MRQKVTWIIPGILVTLLLGLLWAMPAFAADAGDIELLDSDGDEISYLSLNGLGSADDPITIQVTDQDLNEPTKYTGARAVIKSGVTDDAFDWTDLADRSKDGVVNYKDFTALDDGPDNDPGTDDDVAKTVARGEIDLDVTNGILKWTPKDNATTHLEFHLNEQLTIGAFVSSHTENPDRAVESLKGIVNALGFASPEKNADLARQNDDDGNTPTWADVLADPDGDGDYAEHIDAIVEHKYTYIETLNADRSKSKTADKLIDVELKVEVLKDEDGQPSQVQISGVSIDPDDDVSKTAPYDPITTPISIGVKANDKITLTYDTVYRGMGSIDQIGLVTVDSSGGARTSVALRETSASSGKFGADVMICSSDVDTCSVNQGYDDKGKLVTSAERPGMVKMPVDAAGDTITLRYRDAAPRTNRSANISLDINPPAFSNLAPASGAAGKDAEPDVSYEVVDGESGIADDDDANSLRIVAALFAADAETDSLIDGPVTLDRDDLNVDELTDGFSVEARLREGNRKDSKELNAGGEDEYEIRWWAVAMDAAGNTGVSDSDSDTPCTYSGAALENDDLLVDVMAAQNVGTDDEESCDPNVIRVDSASPDLVSAETGVYLDGDDEKTGSLTSVVARFDEALDCDSVSADDFEVDGAAPNDVTCKGSNVYLNVDEMDSNDTPDVEVAEEAVGDRAGNLIGEDAEVESTDGIPAGISVTVTGTASGDRPVTDGTITITISSDERLSGRPEVEIMRIEEDYSLGSDEGGTAAPTGASNEWEFEKDLDNVGLYNVYVTAEDRVSSGESTAGLSGATSDTLSADDLKSDSIILFEVDNAVSKPTFDPEDDGETDNANIFIRVNFENEGNEYGLAAMCTQDGETDKLPNLDGKCDEGYTKSNTAEVAKTPGDVATDFDTSGTVTVTSAMFNGADVTDDVITRDNVLFVYRPGNLTDGDHKLELEVEDSAGNEDDFSVEFAKTPRKPYKLELNPGPNLISFPGNPEDGDVNAVFGGEGNEDITRVLSFDNATGLWMAATKGADGAFMGDLTTINGMNGYWVLSGGVLDVSVVLESTGSIERPPPHIAVQKGWNLIGVVDAQQRIAGSGIATSDYFANIDAQVVYGFDTLSGRLARLSIAKAAEGEEQDNVKTGSAYWVYANEAGVIIP